MQLAYVEIFVEKSVFVKKTGVFANILEFLNSIFYIDYTVNWLKIPKPVRCRYKESVLFSENSLYNYMKNHS